MPTNAGFTDPTRSSVAYLRDVTANDAATWEDGNSSCSSEQDEVSEVAYTRTLSQTSTGVVQLGGAPSNIHMENSSDVQIGSRLNYNAPVTINQCVHVVRDRDVVQDGGLLREAIRSPMHLLDPKDNTPQATLISLHEGVRATSGLKEAPAVSTTRDKLISFCQHRKACLAAILVLLLLLAVILVTLTVYFTYEPGRSVNERIFYPPPEDPEPNPNTTLPGHHRLYSKEDWSGQPPRYSRPLRHPTPFVVISHTATSPCFTAVSCMDRMRNLQDGHMGGTLQLPDIGYSFVAGGDGNVYEGRGWDVTNMHTGFVQRCNIAVSFIGNFVHDTPTNQQIEAVKELLELGLRLGKIDENYKLVAMNETFNTLSPGVVVYDIISTWPHFWRAQGDDIGMCPYTV